MSTGEIQQQLFAEVKRKIGENGSLADDIAKLLDISSDSAYRRIRGEKTISLDELHKLCTHYKISLDQLMNIQTGSFMFQGRMVDSRTFTFQEYLTGMMHTMAYFNSFKDKEFYYSCKDMPIFHHFHLKEFAAFKRFFWLKTYIQSPELAQKKFSVTDYPDEIFDLEQKVLNLYNQMPSIEIWNIESMNIIFRQIEFYQDGDVFESENDILLLYEAVEKTWDHLEKQAAKGYKFKYDDPQQKPLGEFKMYFNEVLLGDNSQLIILDGVKMSSLTHSTFNYMMTRDLTFTENMYNHFLNQIKRSTLISEVSEKERAKFFRIVRDRISRRKDALKA